MRAEREVCVSCLPHHEEAQVCVLKEPCLMAFHPAQRVSGRQPVPLGLSQFICTPFNFCLIRSLTDYLCAGPLNELQVTRWQSSASFVELIMRSVKLLTVLAIAYSRPGPLIEVHTGRLPTRCSPLQCCCWNWSSLNIFRRKSVLFINI